MNYRSDGLIQFNRIYILQLDQNRVSNFERSGIKKEKSWSLRLFLIALNSFLFYFLLDISFLLTLSYFTGGLFFAIVSYRYIKSKREEEFRHPEYSPSPADVMQLAKKYLLINRRYFLATIAGLILATVVISQIILLSASYQQDSFSSFVDDVDSPALNIDSWGISNQVHFDLVTADFNENIPQIASSNNLHFDYIDSFVHLPVQIQSGPIQIVNGSTTNYIMPFNNFILMPWSESIKNQLVNYPSFIQDDQLDVTKAFLITGTSDFSRFEEPGAFNYGELDQADYITNGNITLIAGNPYRQDENFLTSQLEVTGSWKWQQIDEEYGWDKRIDNYRLLSNVLLVPEDTHWTIYDNLQQMVIDANELQDFGHGLNVNFEVYVKIPSVSDSSVEQFINDLNRFENDVQSYLFSISEIIPGQRIDFFAHGNLVWEVESYLLQREFLPVVLAMVSVPLIGIAVFLVYFSLTLVEQRKARLISIMKIRGSSRAQLQAMLVSEVIISAILAVIVGMILSIPWVQLTLRTEGFFQFGEQRLDLVIPANWYFRVPLIGVILTLDLNLSSLMSLSKTTIDEGEEAVEKKEPFWRRWNLDLILFSISLIYWITIRVYPIPDASTFFFIVYGFGPLLLIALLLSSPLIVARYFADFIGKFSDVLWRVQGGLIALAMRNMRKNRFSSSRLAALLTLGMMLSFMSIIVPSTFQEYGIESEAYRLGADIHIQGYNGSLEVLDVKGVIGMSRVGRLDLFSDDQTSIPGGVRHLVLLGLDPTNFSNGAFWKNNYADTSLSKLVDPLTENKIAISSLELRALGLSTGDSIIVRINDNNTELEIASEFDYFPNLMLWTPFIYDDGYVDIWQLQIAMNLFLLREMGKAAGGYTEGVYLKTAEGVNQTKIVQEIENNLNGTVGVSIEYLDSRVDEFFELDEVRLIISSLQGILIVTVIVSIIGVSYFSFITLSERKKEIGVFRAIGMVKSQLFLLLVLEGMVLLFSGILFGSFMGWFVSDNFFFMTTGAVGLSGGSVPPFTLSLPLRITSIFLGGMIGFTIIAAAIPAYITANKQTGSILRAE